MLIFDPVNHEYTWQGKRVPGVTSIIGAALGDAFSGVPREVLEYARQRGKAVHRACELDAAGKLDEASVADEIRPYLVAWRDFRRMYPINVVRSEFPMFHGALGYAGMPDIVFETPCSWGIIDIKTGLPGIRAKLQTAAYLELAKATLSPTSGAIKRFALQLGSNGRPTVVEHGAHAADWRDFLSCLNVYNLKLREAA